MTLDEALALVREEFLRATKKHPGSFNSSHEGWAVIWEELDEMWDEVRANNREGQRHEVVQVGAMAVRYLVDL